MGFAKLQMLQELQFSETVYGLGAGIFFIGYFLFEIPSNIILHKVGARIWIARIMVTWGIDVYKRQGPRPSRFLANGAGQGPAAGRPGLRRLLSRKNNHGLIAVSYTHLDVYKRQASPCPTRAS